MASTTTATATTGLNISVEHHLVETLRPLVGIAPDVSLEQYISASASTIPYDVLQSVSRWARSSAGISALRSRSLNPQDYSMIALLAGVTTSPERKFPPYTPPAEPEVIAAQRAAERKAIAALINGLLSIGGAAFAAFWASGSTGWPQQWRALFTLLVAILVASAEGGLYFIWLERHKPSKPRQRDKMIEPPEATDATNEDVVNNEGTTLRRRHLQPS